MAQRDKIPDPRPAETESERLLQQVIDEYLEYNGIRPLPIEFGAYVPKNPIAMSCSSGEGDDDIARITRIFGTNEPRKRGKRWESYHHTEVNTTTTDRLSAYRLLAHESLSQHVTFIGRVAALHAAGSANKNPLWSLDVHPVVRAMHPDIEAILAIDVEDVGERFKLVQREGFKNYGWGEVERGALVLHHVELAHGLFIDQTGSGTYIHIDEELPSSLMAALPGRRLCDVISQPRLPEDIKIRTAIEMDGDIRLKIDDGRVPAADSPNGAHDWRRAGTVPTKWGRLPDPKTAKPPKPGKTPIAHADTGLPWHTNR